ncbi:MAG: hypothetical protein OXC63_11340 [Aestuariivita sp.]|nr:hypothetical protein [Aestuariivita sp.]MCY4347396.1 hypothetical protein [Aestuariivita sp.]
MAVDYFLLLRSLILNGVVRILYGAPYIVSLCCPRNAKRTIVIVQRCWNTVAMAIEAGYQILPNPIKTIRLASGSDAQNPLAAVPTPTLTGTFHP